MPSHLKSYLYKPSKKVASRVSESSLEDGTMLSGRFSRQKSPERLKRDQELVSRRPSRRLNDSKSIDDFMQNMLNASKEPKVKGIDAVLSSAVHELRQEFSHIQMEQQDELQSLRKEVRRQSVRLHGATDIDAMHLLGDGKTSMDQSVMLQPDVHNLIDELQHLRREVQQIREGQRQSTDHRNPDDAEHAVAPVGREVHALMVELEDRLKKEFRAELQNLREDVIRIQERLDPGAGAEMQSSKDQVNYHIPIDVRAELRSLREQANRIQEQQLNDLRPINLPEPSAKLNEIEASVATLDKSLRNEMAELFKSDRRLLQTFESHRSASETTLQRISMQVERLSNQVGFQPLAEEAGHLPLGRSSSDCSSGGEENASLTIESLVRAANARRHDVQENPHGSRSRAGMTDAARLQRHT
eukprot:TRINITY_DN13353_c0_g1_i1.p1 TRINITY_DN13353_c0_g1~~TRINITY_DN13353_c0_g1_i1.p1  ORF type:complete len:415 (-),score=82.01 TRINITY_DN13353_c0_g1_i1:129-1373(-)